MQNSQDSCGAKKEEFELIAAELGVPEAKRARFVHEALVFAEILSWLRGQNHDYKPISFSVPAKSLKQTNQNLKSVIGDLRRQWFFLRLGTSLDFGRSLAQLLDHPSAVALLPNLRFITPDDQNVESTPQFAGLKGASSYPKELQIRYAEDPDIALIGVLELLQKLLEAELEGYGPNSGGRPKDRIKHHILEQMHELHDEVFDRPANSTPNGSFCTMCALLFESFGEPTKGLDEAIKRFLKQYRSLTV